MRVAQAPPSLSKTCKCSAEELHDVHSTKLNLPTKWNIVGSSHALKICANTDIREVRVVSITGSSPDVLAGGPKRGVVRSYQKAVVSMCYQAIHIHCK